MKLGSRKKIAASILKCSEKRIKFDESRLEEVKESITKIDVRNLIKQGAITKVPEKGISKGRSSVIKKQKAKGRQRSHGSRKGKKTARTPKKETWINNVRKQRGLIQRMRDNGKIDTKSYRQMFMKIKGGFFRSVRHIKLYANEHKMIKE